MTKAKGKKRKIGAGDVASNRYASYRYELTERIECGVVLQGTEVKALRASGAQLKDGYASIRDGELWLQIGPHPALPAGLTREPRPGAPAQAAATPLGDRAHRRVASPSAASPLCRRASTSRVPTPRLRSRLHAARICTTSAKHCASVSPSGTWNGASGKHEGRPGEVLAASCAQPAYVIQRHSRRSSGNLLAGGETVALCDRHHLLLGGLARDDQALCRL